VRAHVRAWYKLNLNKQEELPSKKVAFAVFFPVKSKNNFLHSVECIQQQEGRIPVECYEALNSPI
jgi:hypothetical protein